FRSRLYILLDLVAAYACGFQAFPERGSWRPHDETRRGTQVHDCVGEAHATGKMPHSQVRRGIGAKDDRHCHPAGLRARPLSQGAGTQLAPASGLIVLALIHPPHQEFGTRPVFLVVNILNPQAWQDEWNRPAPEKRNALHERAGGAPVELARIVIERFQILRTTIDMFGERRGKKTLLAYFE